MTRHASVRIYDDKPKLSCQVSFYLDRVIAVAIYSLCPTDSQQGPTRLSVFRLRWGFGAVRVSRPQGMRRGRGKRTFVH